ncbi:hypothetical protein L1887_46802 [Cichorium endivia]|nr:hypothetical protein L1887_46802 [Cichorium endivia]
MPSIDSNSPLRLAFPAADIPTECFSLLGDEYELRPLASSDYARGFNEVLSCLVETPDLGEAAWLERFDAMVAANGTYFPIVIVSKSTDRIVAMGSVVVELKFFRGLTRVGHVEDIVVNTKLHSKGLGKVIVSTVMKIAEAKGCSNIILNCSDEKKRELDHSMTAHRLDSSANKRFAFGVESLLRKVRLLLQRAADGQEDPLSACNSKHHQGQRDPQSEKKAENIESEKRRVQKKKKRISGGTRSDCQERKHAMPPQPCFRTTTRSA